MKRPYARQQYFLSLDEPLQTGSRNRRSFLRRTLAIAASVLTLVSVSSQAAGSIQGLETLRRWNKNALDVSGFDHTLPSPEQLGPCRSSRAMAIVHIAMFDSANAVFGGYESYTGVRAQRGSVSVDAAIAQAAHDALVDLFPAQTADLDAKLAQDLARIRNTAAKTRGIDLGRRAAAAILLLRLNDGSEIPEPFLGVNWTTSNDPGRWRQDPVSQFDIVLGGKWKDVAPFIMDSASQFRAPEPPSIASPEYAAAYDEAKRLGGDGVVTPTERTAQQTFVGIFWAYDGTPSLCAPPRLYNQIAMRIATSKKLGTMQLARLLALVNVAMADAGIAVWDSKYHYDYWRPVAGIRESDPGTGPTGLGDGNPATVGDLTFSPLGAPASNLSGPNFTPPFPAYPSGHAGFGGALFQTLRRFFGTDNIRFAFLSDEFNGVTRDNQGNVRPRIPRTFSSLSQAEEENGQSRIYLGIHWSFDKTAGIDQGRQVADHVFGRAFRPASGGDEDDD